VGFGKVGDDLPPARETDSSDTSTADAGGPSAETRADRAADPAKTCGAKIRAAAATSPTVEVRDRGYKTPRYGLSRRLRG